MRWVLLLAALLLSGHADARGSVSYMSAPGVIIDRSAFRTPTVRISAGQSWRTNYFSALQDHGFPPETSDYLTPMVISAVFPSQLMPLGMGINYPAGATARLLGMNLKMLEVYPPPATGQDSGDAVDMGRAGILAQQLLRQVNNKPIAPIINYNMGCPSSDWDGGPCGGLKPGSTPWTSGTNANTLIQNALPSNGQRLNKAVFKSVAWTQGGALDGTAATTTTQWTAMEAAYDALNLPGAGTTGMLFYIGIRTGLSSDTSLGPVEQAAWQFVRANANGRTIGTTPMYPFPFLGTDNIHVGDYGTLRMGEIEGLAAYVTEDEGMQFKPLWRALSGNITRNGQVLTVPFDRPVGSFFASAQMAWMSDANDGIKDWPQKGFHVKRGGVDLTVSPAIVGMTVQLTITDAIASSDVLEVSYAYYGPGGPSPGNNSGVGGNLMIAGPPSTLFPGKRINVWAWPFLENFTVP